MAAAVSLRIDAHGESLAPCDRLRGDPAMFHRKDNAPAVLE